jgi:hypothetical protein
MMAGISVPRHKFHVIERVRCKMEKRNGGLIKGEDGEEKEEARATQKKQKK